MQYTNHSWHTTFGCNCLAPVSLDADTSIMKWPTNLCFLFCSTFSLMYTLYSLWCCKKWLISARIDKRFFIWKNKYQVCCFQMDRYDGNWAIFHTSYAELIDYSYFEHISSITKMLESHMWMHFVLKPISKLSIFHRSLLIFILIFSKFQRIEMFNNFAIVIEKSS